MSLKAKMAQIMLIFIAGFSVFSSFSQSKNSIFFGAGSVVNLPLTGESRQQIHSSISSVPVEYYQKNVPRAGAYFNFGYEGVTWCENEWGVQIPIGLGLMQIDEKYFFESKINTGSGTSVYKGYYQTTVKSLNLFFGPQITYKRNKWEYNARLNLNNAFLFDQKNTGFVEYEDGKQFKYISRNWLDKVDLQILGSLGLGMDYRLNERLSLGPELNVFAVDVSKIVFSYRNNYMKNKVWINPGIKFQWELN